MGWKGPFSSITLVVRAHAERLATERYPNGLLGLEADRETRKQKARDGRAKVIANIEKRVAEAAKVRRWVDDCRGLSARELSIQTISPPHSLPPLPPSLPLSLPPSLSFYQAGKRKPKYPKATSILDSSVNDQDQGMAVKIFHSIVIPFFGYRRKNAPTRPISSALSTVTHHFVCNRCFPAHNNDAQYKIPTERQHIGQRGNGVQIYGQNLLKTPTFIIHI